jgi:hypothetical protein
MEKIKSKFGWQENFIKELKQYEDDCFNKILQTSNDSEKHWKTLLETIWKK